MYTRIFFEKHLSTSTGASHASSRQAGEQASTNAHMLRMLHVFARFKVLVGHQQRAKTYVTPDPLSTRLSVRFAGRGSRAFGG